MKRNVKNNKAFTIIELMVVIVIIGVMVLLAFTKFLGYSERASVANIKSDIISFEKTIEEKMVKDLNFTDDLTKVNASIMTSMKSHLFNKKGLINKENDEVIEGDYFKLKKDDISIKTNLNGDFYLSQGGEVFYYDEILANKISGEQSKPSEPELEPIGPSDVDLGMEKDFTWVKDPKGQIGLNGDNGYFKYIGTNEEVTIPHIIQGVKITSYYMMFVNSSSNIKKVISDNKKVVNMGYMFQHSKSTELNLDSLDTSGVTNMGYMFEYSVAKSLDLRKFNTSNVLAMNQMFQYVSSATIIDVSNFDTSKVRDFAYMFNETRAAVIDVSNFDTSSATSMRGMFQSSSARDLNLTKFNTKQVKNMAAMFSNSAIAVLDLSSFDTSNTTNVQRMFEYSSKTSGIARTQADADKFNSSSNKPSGLKFTVKQ